MSSSRARSGLTYTTIEDESSCAHGPNVKDSSAESSDAQTDNMVGWIVYKMYGVREVKGVVQSYNSETQIYEVLYRDGKTEKVTKDSLIRYLYPTPPEDDEERESAKPAIMNASNAGRKGPARKAAKRKRAPPTAAAKQSKKDGESSGEPPAAGAADSGNGGKTRYRSLRMSAGR